MDFNIIKIEDYTVEIGDIDWELVSQYCMSRQVVITIKKNDELMLSSRGKTTEEFLNYLSFMIEDEEVLEEIKKICKDPQMALLDYQMANSFFENY